MPRLTQCAPLLVLGAVAGLLDCGESSLDSPGRESAPEPAALKRPAVNAPTAARSRDVRDTEEREPEEPAWIVEARENPDPNARLRAIEAWAHNPGETLNPFTYALVDPDESVRARAQELLEEALVRR